MTVFNADFMLTGLWPDEPGDDVVIDEASPCKSVNFEEVGNVEQYCEP